MQVPRLMLPYAHTTPPDPATEPGFPCVAPQDSCAGLGSGEQPRFSRFRPDETLGAASYVVLSALRLDFVDDEADMACRACGTEPLRAAAWLRSRRAAVGHAVSEMRAHDDGGAAYAIMARTRSGPHAPCNVSFGSITSAGLAAWVRPDRMAIVMVSAQWPTAVTGVPHALVVVGAQHGQLSVFDPAGSGNVQEVSTTCLDIVRAGPEAWAEVLCIGRRVQAPQLRLVHAR